MGKREILVRAVSKADTAWKKAYTAWAKARAALEKRYTAWAKADDTLTAYDAVRKAKEIR